MRRHGEFNRDLLSEKLRAFCPVESVNALTDIDPVKWAHNGKKLILLDADNTLLPWRSEDFPDTTLAWVDRARAVGLNLCLVSNTRNRERLTRLSGILGIAIAEGKFKPSREMYVDAMEQFGVTPEQTLMVGDQILTDILGANRAQVDAILVTPISSHEFIGTKINRNFERIVFSRLVDAIEAQDDDFPVIQKTGLFQRKIVRQLAKFGVVGLTSFAIDYSIRMTLAFRATSGDQLLSDSAGAYLRQHFPAIFGYAEKNLDAFFPIAVAAGASVAIINSFFLNRLWTFKIRSKEDRGSQFGKFVLVSLGGLILNVLISGSLNHLIPGDDKNSARIATVIATICVAIWNFSGQRFFAFRSKSPTIS